MTTEMIFRKFPDGDVIAFIPDEPVNYGRISSYMHVGQHGEADCHISSYTAPATPEEYAPLLKELQRMYGPIKVMKRLNHNKLRQSWR